MTPETLTPETFTLASLVSRSPKMRDVFSRAALLGDKSVAADTTSNNDNNILLVGESGVGLQAIAHAIASRAPPAQPTRFIDCRALESRLAESVFFGYTRGTFAAGPITSLGEVEKAQGGTLIVAEPFALELPLLKKFLRMLETRQLRRIGETGTRPFSARVIATTHRSLDELASLIARGAIPQSLFSSFVSSGFLHTPSLEERPEDIAFLLEHFLGGGKRTVATSNAELLKRLERLKWPQNVRSLQRLAHAIADGDPDDGDRVAALILELELLNAIEAQPEDEGPKEVYGDFLTTHRGEADTLGQLIHVQSSNANKKAKDKAPTKVVRQRERRLLDRHQKECLLARVEEILQMRRPDLKNTSSGGFELMGSYDRIDVRHGFIAGVRVNRSILQRLDVLFEFAPALTELQIIATPLDDKDLTEYDLSSQYLERIRKLHIIMPLLGDDSLAAIAKSPVFAATLRELTVSGLDSPEAREQLESPPDWKRKGATKIASSSFKLLLESPHLMNVGTIVVDGETLRSSGEQQRHG